MQRETVADLDVGRLGGIRNTELDYTEAMLWTNAGNKHNNKNIYYM